MMIQSKKNPGTWNEFPLFITTQESTIGLFSEDCDDCRTSNGAKKFSAADAVGYATGNDKGTTEWVNVYNKFVGNLEAFNYSGKYASTNFKLGLDLFKREVSLH